MQASTRSTKQRSPQARPDLSPEEQKVVAAPEIRTLELTDEDEFLVLGCDGVFELHTSQRVIDIVRQGLQGGMTVGQAPGGGSELRASVSGSGIAARAPAGARGRRPQLKMLQALTRPIAEHFKSPEDRQKQSKPGSG